jgi:hypothetical protein
MKRYAFLAALASPAVILIQAVPTYAQAVVIPVGVEYSQVSNFDSETGAAAEVVRVYYPPQQGIPTSVTGEVANALAAGEKVVVSFAPAVPVASAQLTDMSDFCSALKKGGDLGDVWVDVWHEPQQTFGSTNADAATFVADYEEFANECLGSGVQFGPIYNTYPIYNTSGYTFAAWEIPAHEATYVGIDTYPGDDGHGSGTGQGDEFYDPLDVASPVLNYAHSNDLAVGIAETGVNETTDADSTDQGYAETYLNHYKNFGGAWLMYYNSGDFDIGANGGVLESTWAGVYAYHQ